MKRLLAIAMTGLVIDGSIEPARAGDGGAIAAGIIGGLALGGLAAAAAAPRYGYPVYGYPAYGYDPAPYRRFAANCWQERRRSFDDFGNVYFRRVRVCN